jgi:tartrate-resistant acid phosphatase type 5
MPDYYSEPFLNLAGLTHKSALIAWGAFYFRVRNNETDFKLVDDQDLDHVHPPRHQTVGARSEPYGKATVEVMNSHGEVVATAFTETTNHCWVTGLQADTEYTYRVIVNEEEWAGGDRRNWERLGNKMGLGPKRKPYRNRFRTHPDPTQPSGEPFTFAVIGDFGVGIKQEGDREQRQIAEALEKAVDQHDVRLILTTGDNIYKNGDEDDDWYFTYYQPYRYLINRVPVYPTIGNHDAGETESRDDRDQLIDNFYINERIAGEEAAGRASVDPGLFYRFRYHANAEFICIDTSKEPEVFPSRLFDHPKHKEFFKTALPETPGASPVWRIPFCHHPPFSAGPEHHNTGGMEALVQRFHSAGVKVVFSGHQHHLQLNRVNGIDYLISGAAGKVSKNKPNKFNEAGTVCWSPTCHFLLVKVEGKSMTIRAIGKLNGVGELVDIPRKSPSGAVVSEPIIVNLP